MKLLVGILALLAGSYASVLDVIHSPKSVRLSKEASFPLSQLPSLYSHILGISSDKPSGWNGGEDVLKRPECVAVFVVTAPNNIKPQFNSQKQYRLPQDESPDFTGLVADVKQAFPVDKMRIVEVSEFVKGTHEDDLNQMITAEEVKTKSPPLRKELSNMKAVAFWLNKSGREGGVKGVPDVFVFKVRGLVSVLPEERERAVKELTHVIHQVSEELNRVYEGSCFISAVTQEEEKIHKRQKRDTDTSTSSTSSSNDGVPGLYNFSKPDYPVAFNIILWTSLILSLTVLFVAVGMWFMDPGKDSIIYRMTMQRAKKD